MDGYDYVVCLFCLSGKEKEAVESIHKKGYGSAMFPLKIRHFLEKKKWKEQAVPLFSGYVFVYLTEAEKDCRYKLSDIPEVIRVLSYGDEYASWLKGSDLEFARQDCKDRQAQEDDPDSNGRSGDHQQCVASLSHGGKVRDVGRDA